MSIFAERIRAGDPLVRPKELLKAEVDRLSKAYSAAPFACRFYRRGARTALECNGSDAHAMHMRDCRYLAKLDGDEARASSAVTTGASLNRQTWPKWCSFQPVATKLKCTVGKHMALNDISSAWPHRVEQSLTGKARVIFDSPQRGRRSQVLVDHRIGPPTRYFGISENVAEVLELKRTNEERMDAVFGNPSNMPEQLRATMEMMKNARKTGTELQREMSQQFLPKPQGRPYMAGLGSFLTTARYAEQLTGEPPYGYALSNPTTYVDPSGLKPTWSQTNQGLINECIGHGLTSPYCGGLDKSKVTKMMKCIFACDLSNIPDDPMQPDPGHPTGGRGPGRLTYGNQYGGYSYPSYCPKWRTDPCQNIMASIDELCFDVKFKRRGAPYGPILRNPPLYKLPGDWGGDNYGPPPGCFANCMAGKRVP